jgi:hypothetical protein
MPEDDINKRMNYFDRQFLRASDFKVEQQYHIDRHRRHNRLLHTPGVATEHDLTVTGKEGDLSITVTAGTAIDKEGREIILLNPTKPIPLPFDLGESLELVINFQDHPDDLSTDPGVNGFTRFTEEPNVQIVGAEITPELKQMINDGMAFRLAKMEVEIDENAKTAKLKGDPDNSIRTLAGIAAGTGMTFATVTATSLELKRGNTPTVQITSDGLMKSPMWQVRLSLNAKSNRAVAANQPLLTPPHPHTAQFDSLGGTLLIFASISVLPVPPGNIGFDDDFIVGVNILLDNIKIPDPNNPVPSVPGCARKTGVSASGPLITPHITVTNTLAISNIGKKTGHTLLLRTADSTTLRENDFYSVTILELPF